MKSFFTPNSLVDFKMSKNEGYDTMMYKRINVARELTQYGYPSEMLKLSGAFSTKSFI